MALNFTSLSYVHPKFPSSSPSLNQKHKHPLNLHHSAISLRPTASQSEGNQGPSATEEDENLSAYSGSTSVRARMDLLEQLTSTSSNVDGADYESDGSSRRLLTIRDQLAQLVGPREGDFTIPLGKNLSKFTPKLLTVSQKRNIKRQTYLNEVSQRNDSVFFATIGAFILLPPFVILGIAISTGYVQLFP